MGLFSTTHHHHHKSSGGGSKNVTVHEHRAPTDKSVELLNEFQTKAENNIIFRAHIKDNSVNFTAYAFSDSKVHAYDEYRWHLKFSINGKEHSMKGETNFTEIRNLYPDRQRSSDGKLFVYHMYRKVIEYLAEELIKGSPDLLKMAEIR